MLILAKSIIIIIFINTQNKNRTIYQTHDPNTQNKFIYLFIGVIFKWWFFYVYIMFKQPSLIQPISLLDLPHHLS